MFAYHEVLEEVDVNSVLIDGDLQRIFSQQCRLQLVHYLNIIIIIFLLFNIILSIITAGGNKGAVFTTLHFLRNVRMSSIS